MNIIITRLKYDEESNNNKNYKLFRNPRIFRFKYFYILVLYLYMDVFQIVTLDKRFKRLACMP